MTNFNRSNIARLASFVGLALLSGMAVADTVQIEGIIKSRSGDAMVLQTSTSPHLVVLLTDSTQVGQVQGMFKARRKEMSMAALIPGLQVKVEGEYTNADKMIATSVSFKGNDLERAQAMQAGM